MNVMNKPLCRSTTKSYSIATLSGKSRLQNAMTPCWPIFDLQSRRSSPAGVTDAPSLRPSRCQRSRLAKFSWRSTVFFWQPINHTITSKRSVCHISRYRTRRSARLLCGDRIIRNSRCPLGLWSMHQIDLIHQLQATDEQFLDQLALPSAAAIGLARARRDADVGASHAVVAQHFRTRRTPIWSFYSHGSPWHQTDAIGPV